MKNAATGWHNAQSLFKWIPGEKVKDLREQSSGMQTQKLPMSHLCKPMTRPRCSHSKKCFCSRQMRSKQNATVRIWNKCGIAYTGLLCREGILVRPRKKKKKGKWWHGIKSTILCVWERFTGNTNCMIQTLPGIVVMFVFLSPKKHNRGNRHKMEEGTVYQVISVQPVGTNTWATVSSALGSIPQASVCCAMVIYRRVWQKRVNY